jgi:creatinine amidohydrolase
MKDYLLIDNTINSKAHFGLHLGDLSWDEAREYIEKGSQTLIIPVGTCEQHGFHLPLNNDILVSEYLAAILSEKTGAMIAPTINYGVNLPCDITLSGTAAVTPEILRETLVSLTRWWREQGIRLFVLLTYHGDPFHLEALDNIDKDIALLEPYEIEYSDILERQSTIRHACEAETSLALYLYPQKVRVKKIKEHDVPFPEFKPYLFHDLTDKPEGYVGALGYPSAATAEKGELIAGRMIEKMLEEYRKIING